MIGDENWLLNNIKGSLGQDTYARKKHGSSKQVIIQRKPKRKQRTTVEKEHASMFKQATQIGKTEYQDPVRRAEWEARYAAEPEHRLSDGKKKPSRLWDYVCREIYERMRAEKSESTE